MLKFRQEELSSLNNTAKLVDLRDIKEKESTGLNGWITHGVMLEEMEDTLIHLIFMEQVLCAIHVLDARNIGVSKRKKKDQS